MPKVVIHTWLSVPSQKLPSYGILQGNYRNFCLSGSYYINLSEGLFPICVFRLHVGSAGENEGRVSSEWSHIVINWTHIFCSQGMTELLAQEWNLGCWICGRVSQPCTIGILSWIVLCWSCSVHHGMFSSIPGLCPQGCYNPNIPRYCRISSMMQKHSSLETTDTGKEMS